MGLEDVEVDIRKRIESKVATIRKSAQAEVDQIINEAKARVKELKKARDLEVQKISDELRNREIATANLQAKKAKMDAKRDAIERVYDIVREKIMKLDPADKNEILSTLIERAKKDLPDTKYIMCSSADVDIVGGIVKKYGLHLQGNLECIGGIAVENSDHTIRIDYTFDTLLERFRRDTLREVAEQLFGK